MEAVEEHGKGMALTTVKSSVKSLKFFINQNVICNVSFPIISFSYSNLYFTGKGPFNQSIMQN